MTVQDTKQLVDEADGLRANGSLDEAANRYRCALTSHPEQAGWIWTVAIALMKDIGVQDAAPYLDRIVEGTNSAEAIFNLGNAYALANEWERALRCYGEVLAVDAHHFGAHLRKALTLPVIYPDAESLTYFRRRYTEQISALADRCEALLTHADAAQLRNLPISNFFFAYQCSNDKAVQTQYGNLLHKVAAKAYPEYTNPLKTPESPTGKRIKVGYVSCFFRFHSNFHTGQGFVTKLDNTRFEVYTYHLGEKFDACSAELAIKSEHFYHGKGRSISDIARRILSDGLDILVYVGLGMESTTLRLACMRLAPVQCASWGHPVTTGLPTIDYYLSSQLMEPEDAQDNYSEILVNLPNLGVSVRPPSLPDLEAVDLGELGIPQDAKVLLCSQSLFKLLPQYDFLFARLSAALPECLLVFIAGHSQYPHIGEHFRKRLSAVYRQYQLDAAECCKIVKRLGHWSYLALNKRSVVAIDPFGWSGCNTSFDAISVELPIVTRPGYYMRERHTYALLKILGLEECVASSVEDYIEIVTRLVRDVSYRNSVVGKIRDNRHRVYDDTECISALQEFYTQVVHR